MKTGSGRRMDPEIRAALASAPPSPAAHDVHGLRRYHHQLARTHQAPEGTGGVAVQDLQVPGPAGQPEVPVRLYRPVNGGILPGLLYLHDGGFVAGDLDTAHPACLQLSAETGAVVVSVGYRLAPEHPYPAAVEDCYTVLGWVAANAAELGIDARRLALVGASSGGTLAAATALMARDRNGPPLALQLLKHAPLDDRSPAGQSPGLRPMWQQYLGNKGREVPPYAAPARATHLAGLPPAYVLTAELDPFRDEGISYATRLLNAGVSVELHVVRGATHCFDLLAPGSAIARRTTQDYHHALRTVLTNTALATTTEETP